MPKDTPSARTKRLLESQGYIVAKTEYRSQYAGPPHMKCPKCGKNKVGLTKDMFGYADHEAFKADEPGIIHVQSTSDGQHSARRKKILANKIAKAFVQQPERFIMIVSWKKRPKKKADGKRSQVKEWVPRIEIITWDMFEDEA